MQVREHPSLSAALVRLEAELADMNRNRNWCLGPFITSAEAAAMLGVNARVINRLGRLGRLRRFQDRHEIRRWLYLRSEIDRLQRTLTAPTV